MGIACCAFDAPAASPPTRLAERSVGARLADRLERSVGGLKLGQAIGRFYSWEYSVAFLQLWLEDFSRDFPMDWAQSV